MPKRTDIQKIMLIGSGPIVIGQACEFDYSGTQACKALREEGYTVVLLNSNPATIMTDMETADRIYVEPVNVAALDKILAQEKPDALLPTLGGQTGLNVAIEAAQQGILDKHGVELIGATVDVIHRAEDRNLFKATMRDAGLECLHSRTIHSLEEIDAVVEELGLPIIVRPSFTLGGTGGGIAETMEELRRIVQGGLDASLTTEVLLEESTVGWKEFEFEVMRDKADNVVIVCSIENQDPMGIHTGDSITVAPAQTLTDVEYQVLRDATITVMRAIGVETGGSNVQFAVDPKTGRVAVIEMNPRVSRSSALASKATGFPIAKIAAKLAVGYTLDEIPNDITRETPASFEPTLDYCVVKIPRFTFEKFPTASSTLGVSMKSVGETMAIGRNYKEALQKALRSLEIGLTGLDLTCEEWVENDDLDEMLKTLHPLRLFHVKAALKRGYHADTVAELTQIDPWFIDNIGQLVAFEKELTAIPAGDDLPASVIRRAKRIGFSDNQIAQLRPGHATELEVREMRQAHGILPTYGLVDTCAGEFEAYTPYFYSTYGEDSEIRPSNRRKVMILGGGPNRIGQGIEFDYCCVHTAFALRDMGYETIMVNSNPETVSTDYDTSDKLFFEPLTFEDVMNIYEAEEPLGIIVQMGGQTPLNLADRLLQAGARILGTSPVDIDRAENRRLFREILDELDLQQPASDTATSLPEACAVAKQIGFPVMIRPSYVLGGRAMMVAYNDSELDRFAREAFAVAPEYPILIDKFLDRAVEVDVDLVGDGEQVHIGGVMQHIEEAGIHSGDSACVTPPYSLSDAMVERLKDAATRLAFALNLKGLMNVQMAVKDDELYIIEANPRASRTIPFISKATGLQLAKIATRVMMGEKLADIDLVSRRKTSSFAVKESVFPFNRFAGVDPVLGPEMKSTGEVMGIDENFACAYLKSQLAASQDLPTTGTVFLSAAEADKDWIVTQGAALAKLGFKVVATSGTAARLEAAGIPVRTIKKIQDGHPNLIDLMDEQGVDLLINSPSGSSASRDEVRIRSEAILRRIPLVTTCAGADATVQAIGYMANATWGVRALQDYFARPESAAV